MLNNDYILRGDAVSEICRDCQMTGYCRVIGESCEDVKRIKAIPAADVEPKRKTGYWLPHYDDEGHRFGYICSECGVWYVFDDLNGAHYCMNCGAKMDAEPPKEEES